jgi:hypothetical protein
MTNWNMSLRLREQGNLCSLSFCHFRRDRKWIVASDSGAALVDCQQDGNYPETGFEEVRRIGTEKSASLQ